MGFDCINSDHCLSGPLVLLSSGWSQQVVLGGKVMI